MRLGEKHGLDASRSTGLKSFRVSLKVVPRWPGSLQWPESGGRSTLIGRCFVRAVTVRLDDTR